MLRQSVLLVFALFALNANANVATNNPFNDFLSLEIEKLELEQELFGASTNDEAVSIKSISVYELEEELDLGFDTKGYLPEDFDAREGMHDLDWSTIALYEPEEDLEIGFDTKAYLPNDFNPFIGMNCESDVQISISFNYVIMRK